MINTAAPSGYGRLCRRPRGRCSQTGEERDAEEGASVSETKAPQTGALSIEGLMPSSHRGELQRESPATPLSLPL